MNEIQKDITHTLTSPEEIKHKISAFFPDTAMLDTQFDIVSMSHNILEATKYSFEELEGRSISILSHTVGLKSLIEGKLRPGYFENQAIEVRCKDGSVVSFEVSGFYLGMIFDVNGLIVLRFGNLNEIGKLADESTAKANELDDFIYNTSHALRGPLATLKGLINLIGLENRQEEVGSLLRQMDVFADRLDKQLHQLMYFSEADKIPDADDGALNIQSIYLPIAASIKEASVGYPVNFQCPIRGKGVAFEKGGLVLNMLNNLALFFCQQPKSKENVLVLDALSNSSATEIMMRSKGFLFSDITVERIRKVNLGYSEILRFPELTHYYAAKKIMRKLGGNIQFMLVSAEEVVMLMTIPRCAQALGIMDYEL